MREKGDTSIRLRFFRPFCLELPFIEKGEDWGKSGFIGIVGLEAEIESSV